MSFWAQAWAFEQEPSTSGAKFTLVCLASFADENGFSYPGQETLATMMCLKERAVRGHLATLEEDGFIRRQERRNEKGQRTSDGIWLLAPIERLKPPAKIAGRDKATGKKRHDLPAKNDRTYRQKLPGNMSVEPSVEQLGESESNGGEVRYLDDATQEIVKELLGVPKWDKNEDATIKLVADAKKTFPHVNLLELARTFAYKVRNKLVGPYKLPSRAFGNWTSKQNERVQEQRPKQSKIYEFTDEEKERFAKQRQADEETRQRLLDESMQELGLKGGVG